ncbi:uncharacterized protein N7496_006306 [Penicillium cataractarum]|uniref:DUF7730 domain-containing protein n=1 Tax=Penicillium cataractarum TaxID=2100454 RepID=A0A9W9S380_9EURO|nr:uncharacterized protein N7496_006306 [Penicillium cataractarum]KAJ5370214.1 hypothetical protein N7496_006306 [Penicillium cataractarum]
MRHFDAWVIRDPYSIWHYYTTGQRWKDTVRDLIHDRKICAPLNSNSQSTPIDLYPPSSPPDTTSTTSSTTIHQASPLLTRLPPEIRAMIWSYVFGADTLHLPAGVSPHHPHPQHPPAQTLPSSTHTLTPALPSTLSNSSPALLRTCRSIYAETLNTLYKASTFDVDDLYTFIAFTQSLPSHALSSITRLTIQWSPIWTPLSGQDHKHSIYAHTHSDTLWLQFWARVASLPSLSEIRLSIDLGSFTGTVTSSGDVVLGGSGVRIPMGVGELWTLPLCAVRGLESFEMAVTARCDVVARRVLEADLCRDAGGLRDWLTRVMCGGREVELGELLGEMVGGAVDGGRLRVLEEWIRMGREEEEVIGKRSGQRLAIMAA